MPVRWQKSKGRQIQDSLADKEYREALAGENVNIGLAIQIFKMRNKRHWSQSDLANRSGKSQKTIQRWEDLNYGGHSLKILKELAAVFDVALRVEFIPFSEVVKDMVSPSIIRPPSFIEEQELKKEQVKI